MISPRWSSRHKCHSIVDKALSGDWHALDNPRAPKIDRIACPWLIRRFIDPAAKFIFAPSAEVIARAAPSELIPFDVQGMELSHVGPACSFDAIASRFGVDDDAVRQIASIVRGADTDSP